MKRVLYLRAYGIVRVYSEVGDRFVQYRSSTVPTYKEALEAAEKMGGYLTFCTVDGYYDVEKIFDYKSSLGLIEVFDKVLVNKTSEDYM